MKSSIFVLIVIFFISCSDKKKEIKEVNLPSSKSRGDSVQSLPKADAATIYSRKQLPVLCYHHIRDTKPGDYVVPPAAFAAQMQALADSGYKTILPDQLYNYLVSGTSIPAKSVMLSFDDTDLEQFTFGASEM